MRPCRVFALVGITVTLIGAPALAADAVTHLSMSIAAPLVQTALVAQAPANDDCIDALPITGEGVFDFDNTLASTDGPPHASCTFFGRDQIANDVWYCWTSTCDSGVRLETCELTMIDSKIAVYDGCACPVGDANLVGCNEDDCALQSGLVFEATAGQQFLIRIGNFAGPSGFPGAGMFSIECVQFPENDDCATATSVAVPSTTAGDTTYAKPDSIPDCLLPITAPGVWYSVVGTGTTITASLCNAATTFDTRMAVYCGSCDDLTCIDGNDQFCGRQSQVSWCAKEGATYYIFVHGYQDETGPFELNVSENGVACTPLIDCQIVERAGACCFCDAECEILTEAACTTAGGSYLGDDSACDDPGVNRYVLHNHPDGESAPPEYGLRLDGLLTGNEADVFAFDFDHPQALVTMEVSAGSVHISGQAYGGLVQNNVFVDPVLWAIDYTYAVGVGAAPGDDDLLVTDCAMSNSGSIQALSGPNQNVIPLVNKCNDAGFSFRFGDEDNELGHRGFAGLSGWGWLNHGGQPHMPYSDFLFTAEPLSACPADPCPMGACCVDDGAPIPIAHWPMDDGSGNAAADVIGGNHAALRNFGAENSHWVGGRHDGAISLDGRNDYLETPSTSTFDIPGDATITGWFKLDDTFGRTSFQTEIVLEKYRNTNSNMILALVGWDYYYYIMPRGTLLFKLENRTDGNGYRFVWTHRTQWERNVWYHYAVVIDSDDSANNKIYINGVDDTAGPGDAGRGSPSLNMDFRAPLRFGGRTADILQLFGSHHFDGDLDDVRLFNFALTDDEIQRVMNDTANCVDATAADCDLIGGDYRGDHTVCGIGCE